jgi:predicted nuclease with TOPRIM domain
MQERLKKRLGELREEFDRGKKKLEALEAESTELRHTLLRISGAIQVLQEELEKPELEQGDQAQRASARG